MTLVLLGCLAPLTILAEESYGTRPLRLSTAAALAARPPHTHLLLDQAQIEQFLARLDGTPPDWATVYGQGHHDPAHDERLFALNRERDIRREGKEPLQWLITFAWFGELSRFDEQEGGFRVALGPKFNQTTWGEVRFKYEDLPATLVALAGSETAGLRARLQNGDHVEVEVLMTGWLIPEESLVSDFSHEQEGRGLIMPVVRIEGVDFLLKNGPAARE